MRNIFFEKILIIVAVFLTVIIVQITLPSMRIFYLGLWPAFIFVFLVSSFEKGVFPIVIAFLTGALIDFISGVFFGTFTLSFFLIALIVKMAQQRLKLSNPFAFAFVFVFCALFFWGISHFLIYVF